MKEGVLYTSGLMPFLPGTGDLVGNDLEVQMHQCMRNMKAVLAAADMSVEDLIMVTIFTTDLQEFATLNKIYGSYFEGVSAYPSRAAVGISALAKGARVELTAIAKK
jgi:2-iminobutanoate/2-iminopropanoate deaminase